MSAMETPNSGLRYGTPIGKCLRPRRRFNTVMGTFLSLVCAIFAAIASFYLAPRIDSAARHPIEIASAALAGAAIVLLFRVFDGRFVIKRRGENGFSSSVIAVALWIACFVVISAAGILIELKDRY